MVVNTVAAGVVTAVVDDVVGGSNRNDNNGAFLSSNNLRENSANGDVTCICVQNARNVGVRERQGRGVDESLFEFIEGLLSFVCPDELRTLFVSLVSGSAIVAKLFTNLR